MTSKLMKECTESCKDQCEFNLKITIQKLNLLDSEKSRGFEDIVLVLTIDSNVMKIDNIQGPDENINIQREIFFQTTPELFARKLKSSSILINLMRECVDLGTIKLHFTDYFSDAVLCNEFECERMFCDYKFIKDGNENGIIDLLIQIERKFIENEEMKDFLRTNALQRERKKNKPRQVTAEYESSSSSVDGLSSFVCDADLLRELCPPTNDITVNSNRSKTSKCTSDIATSLDINQFSESQKTFCRGCRGYSISGVTCDNKNIISRSKESVKKSISKFTQNTNRNKCILAVHRICSECFADLSVIPENVPCPNCYCEKRILKQENKQCKKANTSRESSANYFQRMLKDILVNEKKINDKKVKDQIKKRTKSKREKKIKKDKIRSNQSFLLR